MTEKKSSEEISKAAALIGRLGGLAKSERKKISSKANGKLGGRPAKGKSK